MYKRGGYSVHPGANSFRMSYIMFRVHNGLINSAEGLAYSEGLGQRLVKVWLRWPSGDVTLDTDKIA